MLSPVAAVVHHVLLALAVLAIGHASVRAASRIVPSGLDRLIAAIVLGAATIVVEAIALGLLSLGGDTAALSIAAGLTWLAVLLLVPGPELPASRELARWWEGMPVSGRAVAAALAGGLAVWVAWLLYHPSIGFDASLYHYPEVAGWIANGQPGSILAVSYDIPHGNYPLTDEVALTWGAAISRSWIPLYLWNPALLVVLGLGTWATLRHLQVPARAAGLATAGVVAWPIAIHQLAEPQNDLPMLTWMACTTALAAGARQRPILLAPALVAAGLTLGTKTTALLVVLAALAAALFVTRNELRRLAPWLALGVAAFFAVGGLWYVRNLFQHGSPFWPFKLGPWGDPGPRILELVDTSFLQRPIDTLDGRLDVYSERVAGGWLMLLGALVVFLGALAARRMRRDLRIELVLAGGFALFCLFAWATVPGTGLPTTPGLFQPEGWPISTLRYIQPAVFAATIAVALAARAGRAAEIAASTLLAGSLLWTLIEVQRMGFPFVPSPETLLVGAAGGVVALFLLAYTLRLLGPRLRGAMLGAAVAVAAVVVTGTALAQVSDGFISRHAQVDGTTALGPDLVAWFAARPGFENGSWPVAFIGRSLQGPLAGDHFSHELTLLAPFEPCRNVHAAARRGPVVVTDPGFLYKFIGVRSYNAHHCLADRRPAYRDVAFRVYLP
jgi:hypothetical protein